MARAHRLLLARIVARTAIVATSTAAPPVPALQTQPRTGGRGDADIGAAACPLSGRGSLAEGRATDASGEDRGTSRGNGGNDAGTQNLAFEHTGGSGVSVPMICGGGSSSPLHARAISQLPTTTSRRPGPTTPLRSSNAGTAAVRVQTLHRAQEPPTHSASLSHGQGSHHVPAWEVSPRAPSGHAGGAKTISARALAANSTRATLRAETAIARGSMACDPTPLGSQPWVAIRKLGTSSANTTRCIRYRDTVEHTSLALGLARRLVAVALVASLFVACGDGTATGIDAGAPFQGDGGSVASDAGRVAADGGPPPSDGGMAPVDGAAPGDGALDSGTVGLADGDPGVDRDGGPGPTSDECETTGGFCWLRPTFTGADLAAIHGTSEDDIWTVGAGGSALHFDGTTWTPSATGVLVALHDVYALAEDDVWAVGEGGTVIRFDGAAWERIAVPTTELLTSVAATSASDVWVGGDEVLWHWDGAAWTIAIDESYAIGTTRILALAPDDVWVGNRFAGARHFDGATWSWTEIWLDGIYDEVSALWGTSPDDVWVGSPQDNPGRWDGTAYRGLPWDPGTVPVIARAIHGTAPDDVWFAGELGVNHFDGAEYIELEIPVEEGGSVTPTGVFAVADRAFIVGLGGAIFEARTSGVVRRGGAVTGDWTRWFSSVAFSAGEAWFFGLGTSMRFDGTHFVEVPTATTEWRQDFGGAWAAAPDDIWIAGVGQGGVNIQHWDGASWSFPDLGDTYVADFMLSVWGSGPDDVYFGGLRCLVHWDGSRFEETSVVSDVDAIGGTARDDVWAVGNGHVSHFDGTTWTSARDDGAWWTSVAAIARDDVWIAGQGRLSHFDGTAWTPFELPEAARRTGVSGLVARGPDDVWGVAGDLVVHWDGTAWRVHTAIGVGVSDVAAAPDGTLFLTGWRDAVLRRRE
jgi:hypothetical protein